MMYGAELVRLPKKVFKKSKTKRSEKIRLITEIKELKWGFAGHTARCQHDRWRPYIGKHNKKEFSLYVLIKSQYVQTNFKMCKCALVLRHLKQKFLF